MATDWRIQGDEVGSCNCVFACPCQFEADPSEGFCQAIIGWSIREGHFGDTDLSGVKFAEIVAWPGPIYEGDGTTQLVIDEAASDEQRQAIIELSSGQHGGAYFEIFSSVLPHVRDPITAPIEIESDARGRHASMRIGDIAESRIEPIKSPVDGSEHQVRIDLPNGFEYKIAEIGDTVSATSKAEAPLEMKLEHTYAQLNEFDWSPA